MVRLCDGWQRKVSDGRPLASKSKEWKSLGKNGRCTLYVPTNRENKAPQQHLHFGCKNNHADFVGIKVSILMEFISLINQ